MLQSAEINNFQSHKSTVLEFCDGVNVIVGTSDSGKSAILRALRLAIQNQPLGDAYRSNWGGDTSVILTTEEGNVITRAEGSERFYQLNDIVFKAFGKTVPEEINQALNISEINLQLQHDQPFLLTSTPGEVAQHFNRIGKLEKISIGLSNVDKSIRAINSSIENDSKQLATAKAELESFEFLEKFEINLEVLEELEKQQTGLVNAINRLFKLSIVLTELDNAIIEQEEILAIEPDLNAIFELIGTRNDLENDIDKLQNSIDDLIELEGDIVEQEILISLSTSVDSLISLIESRAKSQLEIDRLNTVIKTTKNLDVEIKEASSNLKLLEKSFEDNMGDFCVLCGTSLKHEH